MYVRTLLLGGLLVSSISAADLAIGDYLEWELLETHGPSEAFAPGFLAGNDRSVLPIQFDLGSAKPDQPRAYAFRCGREAAEEIYRQCSPAVVQVVTHGVFQGGPKSRRGVALLPGRVAGGGELCVHGLDVERRQPG